MDPALSQLLVRDASPDDRVAAAPLLAEAGWSSAQIDAWNEGMPALVLCDPADGTVHGAVVAGECGLWAYDLVAWAAAATADSRTVADRLVRAIADRARRRGGERLVITVHDDEAAALLEASGFEAVSVMTYHLEL